MVTYLVYVPTGQLLMTFAMPWLLKQVAEHQRRRRFKRHGHGDAARPAASSTGSEAQHALRMRISNEMTLPRFSGTFDEVGPMRAGAA